MPCSIDLKCWTMMFITFFTSCIVYLSDRLMLSGLHRWKYSSILFDQQSRTISGSFLGLFKSFVLVFWHTCTAWCIRSSGGQYGSQQNDDILPYYQFLIKVQGIETDTPFEMWYRHYEQLLYQAIVLFLHLRFKAIKRWVQFLWGCIHPTIQGICTWQVSARIFWSNYLYWLVPIM